MLETKGKEPEATVGEEPEATNIGFDPIRKGAGGDGG